MASWGTQACQEALGCQACRVQRVSEGIRKAAVCGKEEHPCTQLAPYSVPGKGEWGRRWAGLLQQDRWTRLVLKEASPPKVSHPHCLLGGTLSRTAWSVKPRTVRVTLCSFNCLTPAHNLIALISCECPTTQQRLGRRHLHFIQGEMTGPRPHNWLATGPD